MRVVFVAGWMRSGTTLLAETLGSAPHAIAVGEITGIWMEYQYNNPCSCGQPVRECPVWGQVLRDVAEVHGIGVADFPLLSDLVREVVTPRRVPQLARLRRQPRDQWPADVERYVSLLETIRRSLTAATGQDILIDSSKSPAALLALSLVPGVRVDTVHLLRDPRAVANSERRTRIWQGVDARLAPPGRGSVSSAAHWASFNVMCRAAGVVSHRYVMVQYEDFTRDPVAEMARLGEILDLDVSDIFLDDHTVRLRESHAAAGNPSRFGDRTRPIRSDLSWQQELPPSHQAAVLAITAPARAGLALAAPRARRRSQVR